MPALNETEITLGDRTYLVRPTLRIVRRIEQIGAPVSLAKSIMTGDIGLTGMSNILQAMLRDVKDPPKLDMIQEALFEDGLDGQVKPVTEFLTNLWIGNRRSTEEAERRAAIEADEEPEDPPPPAH